MKNKPILRWLIYGIIFIMIYMLSLIIYPLAYWLRKPARRYKFYPLWWFLNDSEPDGISDDYGAKWWRKEKGITKYNLWVSYRWSALRNSHWNFKVNTLIPKLGIPRNVKVYKNTTSKKGMTFCNYTILGKQFAKYEIDGFKYFRYSFTREILFGKFMQNVQFGSSSNRFIYKHRIKTS